MGKIDWNEPALIKAWISMSEDNGDVYRQVIVNPVIHGLLRSNVWETAPSPIQSALVEWMKTHGANWKSGSASRQWYGEWGKASGRLSILDLGCGDAYRGRWLSRADVNYVGVDASEGLLESASKKGNFACIQSDLDAVRPLADVWTGRPPDWIFAITLLDHLQTPERLLANVADLYGPGDRGRMLVVTCNPRFYGGAANSRQPTRVRIATVAEQGGEVTVYLRSRHEMRRLFRDAGLCILDEASPHLPSQFAELRTFDASGFNLAFPPLNFWLLEMHSTRRQSVTPSEIKEWLAEMRTNPERMEATQVLLDALVKHAPELAWRDLPAGAAVLGKHNVGGRLFVVKTGTFQLESSGASMPKGVAAKARPRWRFNPGEIFGELELFQDDKEAERTYIASMVAKDVGPYGHARVLEVPNQITRHLMHSGGPLGNPFLTLLRRKVLEALLRFDETVLDPQIRERKRIERLVGADMRNLEGKLVVIVASLLAQGLEAERERCAFDPMQQRMILLSAIRDAVGDFTCETDSNRVNLAIRFLAGAGVIRRARSVVSERPVGAESDDIVRRRNASQRLKEKLNTADWVCTLAREQKEVLTRLMSLQTDCFFVVDDEMMLRRCVLEPSLRLFEDLASRRKFFIRQPPDIERARDDDLEAIVVNSLKTRFESGIWPYDSLGWPIIREG